MLQIDLYKVYLEEKELRPRTIKSYINTLKQLEEYLIKNDILAIDKLVLINYKSYLETLYKNTKTINSKIVGINIYLKWAIKEEELLDFNLDKIKLKHMKQQSKAHRDSPNEADYKKLCRYAINDELRYFIYVIGNTGLRITEVQAITFDDLNETSIKITNKGKSRNIAIPMWLRKELKTFFSYKDGSDKLFIKSQQCYREELKKTASIAKVKKQRAYPHGIRHYFAKAFIKNGGNLADLQQMLGHENISTTAIYLQLNEEELADLFKKQKNK